MGGKSSSSRTTYDFEGMQMRHVDFIAQHERDKKAVKDNDRSRSPTGRHKDAR